jgi:hypothetical protein
MKKLSIIVLLVFLMTFMAACSAGPDSSTEDGSGEGTATEQGETGEGTEETEERVLNPISADQIKDGVYEIDVDSSSSMFRVVKCELTVENGEMNAVMTMSGQGYGKLYMGTGEEALKDSEDTYIPFVLDEEGAKTFTVPVEALDKEIDCAAWSIKKEQWYDRILVFKADTIPADALNSK